MNEDDSLHIVQLILIAVLVVSALAARRLPVRQTLKLALAWLAIFMILFIIIGYRFEIKDFFQHWASKAGIAEQRVATDKRSVIIRRSGDGHFWVEARVNGQPTRLMIDSGASMTAISERARRQAGLDVAPGFGMIVQTANGSITTERTRIETLTIETLEIHDLGAVTSPNFGDINVLGMNFLDRLHSWSVTGEQMTLTPR